jgi:DNA invertase Pin-like site-specific DNA recombinase
MNVLTFLRVAIYARVSTRDKGQDVENQLAQLREFCMRQGWTIVCEHIDNESASTGDRVQFKAMFIAASKREFDLLLFWSLDRFSREGVLPTLEYLNRLTGYGIAWRSFTEQYIDSCGIFKDAVIAIMATIAKQERIRISERTRAGIERARARGAKLGRPRVSPQIDPIAIKAMRASGLSWERISRATNVARSTLMRSCPE